MLAPINLFAYLTFCRDTCIKSCKFVAQSMTVVIEPLCSSFSKRRMREIVAGLTTVVTEPPRDGTNKSFRVSSHLCCDTLFKRCMLEFVAGSAIVLTESPRPLSPELPNLDFPGTRWVCVAARSQQFGEFSAVELKESVPETMFLRSWL